MPYPSEPAYRSFPFTANDLISIKGVVIPVFAADQVLPLFVDLYIFLSQPKYS
jgi:hypothetical protein